MLVWQVLYGHHASVTCLAVSTSYNLIVSGSEVRRSLVNLKAAFQLGREYFDQIFDIQHSTPNCQDSHMHTLFTWVVCLFVLFLDLSGPDVHHLGSKQTHVRQTAVRTCGAHNGHHYQRFDREWLLVNDWRSDFYFYKPFRLSWNIGI